MPDLLATVSKLPKSDSNSLSLLRCEMMSEFNAALSLLNFSISRLYSFNRSSFAWILAFASQSFKSKKIVFRCHLSFFSQQSVFTSFVRVSHLTFNEAASLFAFSADTRSTLNMASNLR